MNTLPNDLLPLQSLEHLCQAIEQAQTLTAKRAGMLGLLMETEYAIEKYMGMARRLEHELSLDVKAQDFEVWRRKLDFSCSAFLLKDIVRYDQKYFDEWVNKDHDLAMAFATFYFKNLNRRLSIQDIDEGLEWRVVTNENSWPITLSRKKPIKEEEGEAIREVRSKLQGLNVISLLVKKFRLLSRMMDRLVGLLADPADEAYYGLYGRYRDEYVRSGGNDACEREVAKWVAEHSGHLDFQHELDIQIAYAKMSICAILPGIELGDIFYTIGLNMHAIGIQIGRYIYAHPDAFKDYSENVQQLFHSLDMWLRLSREKRQLLEAPPSRPRQALPPVAAAQAEPEAFGQRIPVQFAPELRNCTRAYEELRRILRELEPHFNSKGGRRGEKWKWPHLRDALTALGLLDEKSSHIDFGRAISAILPQRTPKSVAQSFKTGRINDDYPTKTDLSIIDEIKARLQPVCGLIYRKSAR